MKIFDVLKKKNYADVFVIGLKFSTNKSGFEEFAQKAWKIAHGDYLRAVVSSVVILQSEDREKMHDIHTLDYIFGNIDGRGSSIIHPLYMFFDDSERSLTNAYRKCINDYAELERLYFQLQKIEFANFEPLIKSTNLVRLMNYNNKKVLISTVSEKEKSAERGVYRIQMSGSSLDSLNVRFGTKRVKLFDTDKGILSIHDPNSLEMIFQNNYVDRENYSTLQKTGYIFGVEEARKYYRERKAELENSSMPAVIVGSRKEDYSIML